eukprot:jgi/Ulvmu1/4154/UM019_0133.1
MTAMFNVVRHTVGRQRGGTHRHRIRAEMGHFGPPPPPVPDLQPDGKGAYDLAEDGKPMWLKDLERDEDFDPDVKQLLEQSGGNLDSVRAQMAEYVENPDNTVYRLKTGRPEPVHVSFREYDPAVVHFWLELYARPSDEDLETLEQAIGSWFIVGKLGGYSSTNLQVHTAATSDVSHLSYETGPREEIKSYYHELGPLECNGSWLRFRADLGTGDEIGLDVLINMLSGCSEDYVGVKQLIVGGENEDWPVDDELKPEVSISPMRVMGRDTDADLGGSGSDSEREEDMQSMLDEIERDHPEKYQQLQNLDSQLRQFGMDK